MLIIVSILILLAFTAEPDPVLHCKPDDYLANSILSLRVLNFGMYVNDLVFTAIPVLKPAFEAATNLLASMIQDPKATSDEKVAQSRLVHKFLKKNCLYAKLVCDNNPFKIELSGYDSSIPATKTPVPETGGITKILKGKTAGTYKVFLLRKSNKKLVEIDPATHPKGVLYTAQLTLTPDDAASWKDVVSNVPSTLLIIPVALVFPGKKNYVRVFGTNSAGRGNPCTPKFFTPDVE